MKYKFVSVSEASKEELLSHWKRRQKISAEQAGSG